MSLFNKCAHLQSKRISAKDALAHPYLDEGRLRYHTCMCKCCYTTSSGRVYTSDFEPVTNPKFDDGFEKNLTSVRQVKGSCADYRGYSDAFLSSFFFSLFFLFQTHPSLCSPDLLQL